MHSPSFGALLSLVVVATACAPETTGPVPIPVAPRATLMLGAAGVPQGTFGDDTAPSFADGFASLAADGFDVFLPIFLTNEDGSGTAETSFFLPTEAVPGIDPATTCTSGRNPWTQAADEGIGVVLPAYLLALDQSYAAPLDAAPYEERLRAFVANCLEGDASKLRGLYLHDEPASNAVGTRLDFDLFNDFHLDNVRAMAAASRNVIDAETFLVEAPLPFALPLFDIPEPDRPRLEQQWRDGLDVTAPLASVYGFDLYAIDSVTDVSPIGDFVEIARDVAPQAQTIAVLQGFGSVDMGIAPNGNSAGRQPTFDETRAMAFEALVRGATGLFWYGQSSLTVDDPGVWAHVREVARELRDLEPMLLAPAVDVDVANDAVHATGRLVDPESGNIVSIIVNPTDIAQTITLDGTATELAPYEVLISQR